MSKITWLRCILLGLFGVFLSMVWPPAIAEAHNCSYFRDCYDTLRAAVSATVGLTTFAVILSMGLDFVPGVGQGKGIIEAITGRDLITGEELKTHERLLGIMGPAGRIADLGSSAVRGASNMSNMADAGGGMSRAAARHADSGSDAARSGGRQADSGTGAGSSGRGGQTATGGSQPRSGGRQGDSGTGAGSSGRGGQTATGGSQPRSGGRQGDSGTGAGSSGRGGRTDTGGQGTTKGASNVFSSQGRVTVDAIKSNPNVFKSKSTDEIAQMLRDNGYDVTIRDSKRSRSGAKIIGINNHGNGKNITQVQISPGGGRHGNNPYVKISTSDQGIIKVVDGSPNNYLTDGAEKATIIFTGGK